MDNPGLSVGTGHYLDDDNFCLFDAAQRDSFS